MSERAYSFLVVLCLSLILTPLCRAESDAVQLELLSQYELPLRWDNVEGTPWWVSGEQPSYQKGLAMHVFRLLPGQSVTVRVPAQQMLRIHGHKHDLAADDLRLALSNGNGLALFLSPPDNIVGQDWIVAERAFNDRLIQIIRPDQHEDAVEVALFISRQETLDEIAPHRLVAPLNADSVQLRREHDAVARPHWSLEAKKTFELSVQGPARYRVEQRYIYGTTETAMEQSYNIDTQLDGEPWQVIEVDTAPESRYSIWVDGKLRVLGRLERGYVDVPEGEHLLSFNSSAHLYVRVMRQDLSDYLIPALNAPELDAEQVRRSLGSERLGPLLTLGESDDIGTTATAVQAERMARYLAQDNRYREGGLTAAALLKEIAMTRPDASEISSEAQRLLARHSFYRDLLPERKQVTSRQHFAWFANVPLASLYSLDEGRVIAEQHVASAAQTLAGGFFVGIPVGIEKAHRYILPQRGASSALRVVVDRRDVREKTEFFVQFDDAKPQRLLIDPASISGNNSWLLDKSEAGAALLALRHGGVDPLTLGGSFSQYKSPAPLIEVSTLELPLPASVNIISIWTERGKKRPSLAVQYRASRSYQLGESAYLAALGRRSLVDSFDGERLRRRLEFDSVSINEKERALHNHWQPLIRFMHSQKKNFTNGVVPLQTIPVPSLFQSDSGSGFQMEYLQGQAQAAAKAERWLDALAAWRKLGQLAKDERLSLAVLGQAEALEHLGESYLARQALRSLFVFGHDAAGRDVAFERMVSHEQSAGDIDALQNLYASAILQQPSVEMISRYVDLLLDDGKADFALILALELPTSRSALDLVLRASYQAGWWQIFDVALKDLSDEVERHRWSGYRAQANGDYQQALSHWQQAGSTGQILGDALRAGLLIRRSLSSDSQDERRQALTAWAHWQAAQSGPNLWRDGATAIVDYAGGVSLYVTDLDIVARSYKTTVDKPVRLQVYGPAQLRLEVRPLHTDSAGAPLDGWLRVRNQNGLLGESLRVLPIINNRPVTGLRRIGDSTSLVGSKVVMEYAVSAGLHQLEVSTGALASLVSVALRQPQLPLAVLPTMTPDTVATVLAGKFRYYEGYKKSQFSRNRQAVCFDESADDMVLHHCRYVMMPSIFDIGSKPKFDFASNLSLTRSISTVADVGLPTLNHTGAEVGVEQSVSVLKNTDDALLRKQMVSLLWQAEADPEILEEKLVEAEELYFSNPHVEGLKPLLSQWGRSFGYRSSWQTLTMVEASAGLRLIDNAGWQPETPALRVRKSLLNIEDPDVHVISGQAQLGLAMYNLESTTVDLTVAMAELPYIVPQSLAVTYRLNDESDQLLIINPNTPTRRSLIVPAGNHVIRIAIVDPLVNQFVQVSLRERRNDQDGEHDVILAAERGRPYHVATAQEPVRLRLVGPAWLRIDEWRATGIHSRYQRLDRGLQTVELRPESGHREALFRIHRRVISGDEAGRVSDRPVIGPTATPVADQRLHVAEHEPYLWLLPEDRLPLAGQEDGTLSVAAELVSRRQVGEEGGFGAGAQRMVDWGDNHFAGNAVELLRLDGFADALADRLHNDEEDERFLQLSSAYRYFVEPQRSYVHGEVLGRLRESGGPTLGLRGWFDYFPQWQGWQLSLNSSAFLQQPGDPLTGESSMEWSTHVGARVSQRREINPKTLHRPYIQGFQRWLSLGKGNVIGLDEVNTKSLLNDYEDLFAHYTNEFDHTIYYLSQVDRDVFTNYKADHRRGLVLGDQLEHRPWLDSEWFVGVALTTNEDLNPFKLDNLRLRTGWQQLLGDWQLGVEYGLRRYFADADREKGISRSSITLDLNWDYDYSYWRRWQGVLQLRRDIEVSDTSLMLGVRWHGGNGRGLRDFRPSEVNFRDLRQRRLPVKPNNMVVEGPGNG